MWSVFPLKAGLKRYLVGRNCGYRSFHCAKAQFTTIDAKGQPVSYETEIRVGEPHEAYVYVDPEVGNAIKYSVMRQIGVGLTQDSEKLSLDFHHKSRHFIHKTLQFPRVEIPRDLPRQTNADVSPATLWLSGNWHAITLDGTPDESFERASRESATELEGALDRLKEH